MRIPGYKYAGIAAIAVEYVALTYFLSIGRQTLSLSHTVSDFGTFDSTRLVFSLAFSLAGVLFGLFGTWLSRKLPLHRNFLITLYVGVIAQIALSWLPVQGNTKPWHYWAATIVMFVMPLLVYYFTLANKNRAVRLLARGILGLEALAIILLPLSIAWHVSLIAEGLTFLGFQLWVALATFEDYDIDQSKRTIRRQERHG